MRAPTLGLAAVAGILAMIAPVMSVDAAAAADPPPPPPAQLVLTGPATARLTTHVTLTATLRSGSDASALAGAPVTFESWEAGSWRQLASRVTDAEGTARLSALVARSTNRFRARYAGNATNGAATSDELAVAGTKYPTRLWIGGDRSVVDETIAHLTLTWRANGRPVPGRVKVYSRNVGGKWHVVRTISLGQDGFFRMTLRPRVDTYWQVVGITGSWYLADRSNSWFLDNRPPGRPVILPAGAPRPEGLPQQRRGFGRGANVLVTAVPEGVWNDMTGISWRPGCPVGRSGLRLVRLNYWGFDGYRHRGELVVNARAAGRFVAAFRDLYAHRIPIRAMYRPDRFGYSGRSNGADDFSAMRHDNTSAFNCRWVTGNPGVRSPHSYGYSLDINTWENPYRSRIGYLPNTWWMRHSNPRYAWRSGSHLVVRIMRRHGFRWSYGLGDTQHFDA